MMKQAIVVAILAIGGLTSTQGHDLFLRFDGGIGVIPASSPAGPVNADGTFQNVKQNVVRGILPAGLPWRIADLKADIGTNGRIRIKGEGLVVAGGSVIGQNVNQRVFATLICEPVSPFVEHSTAAAGVALDPNGDFRMDDVLSPVLGPCESPVLLIRSSSTGAWFAAGVSAAKKSEKSEK